uniref:Uncharacterized protein n=1 Tax=Anguilla anguilla TaxID=7936 RepID=A0A0E9RM76_ANGAN
MNGWIIHTLYYATC